MWDSSGLDSGSNKNGARAQGNKYATVLAYSWGSMSCMIGKGDYVTCEEKY